MRLVEGRDADQSIRTSCALGESDVDGSEEEEDGEEQVVQGYCILLATVSLL